MKNTEGKRDIARYEQFLVFSQCFSFYRIDEIPLHFNHMIMKLLSANRSNLRRKKICHRKTDKCPYINLFPKSPFWDCPKFKEAADDNWNVAIKGF